MRGEFERYDDATNDALGNPPVSAMARSVPKPCQENDLFSREEP
jgi:hypothetical protein